MTEVWMLAALWLGIVLITSFLSYYLKMITALFGLSHGIMDQSQYSILVAMVIGSAIAPTIIANKFLFPKHLLK